MQRVLQITEDGSHTVAIPEMNVTYHSVHGAVQESKHVFIQAGLDYILKYAEPNQTIHIFEMGFGTGLNALLTIDHATALKRNIYYEAAEILPLEQDVFSKLNYALPYLLQIHESDWEKETLITQWFTLFKAKNNLLTHASTKKFDLVYYDAFAPTAQPELWTEEVFKKLHSMMNRGGVLVTYCSKSYVRRNMIAAGFVVEKIPGPPGKREMLRAVKG